MLSLISVTAFAANPEVLKAVLSSEKIRNVQDIQKIEVLNTYRCFGCFDIEVSGTNMFGKAFVKVHTEQTSPNTFAVTLIESSK